MKRYIKSSGQCVDEVNGVNIYDDGQFYIYTEPHGEGRMEFPTREEAVEYILDEEYDDAELKIYDVRFLNKYDETVPGIIEAKDKREARRIAEKICLQEGYDRVLDVLEG